MRLFTDRDLGVRFGRALIELGRDVQLHSDRYPNRGDVPDEVWIPEVTSDGYVILTHDARIRTRPTERSVFEGASARVFVFATKSPTPFVHMRAIMIAWERIEDEVATMPAPFMFGIDGGWGYEPVRSGQSECPAIERNPQRPSARRAPEPR